MRLKRETTESGFNFFMPLYKLFCHYYNSIVIFQGCTQAIAHAGKSEPDAKHKSLNHQYEQIRFDGSHYTDSASLKRLMFCDMFWTWWTVFYGKPVF